MRPFQPPQDPGTPGQALPLSLDFVSEPTGEPACHSGPTPRVPARTEASCSSGDIPPLVPSFGSLTKICPFCSPLCAA